MGGNTKTKRELDVPKMIKQLLEPLGRSTGITELDQLGLLGGKNLMVLIGHWKSEADYFRDKYRDSVINRQRLEKLQQQAHDFDIPFDEQMIRQTKEQQEALRTQIVQCDHYCTILNKALKVADVEAPIFPWLRTGEYCVPGNEVVCFLHPGCEVDQLVIHTFVYGKVVPCYQIGSAKVAVDVTSTVRLDVPCQDDRVKFEVTDPAVMLRDEAIYLQEHAEYRELWLRLADEYPYSLSTYFVEHDFRRRELSVPEELQP